MAEIVGIVGSGVGIASFVVQVADSVIKLKRFVDLMKDAPEELRYLIRSIEKLNGLLDCIDALQQQNQLADADSSIIASALESCRKAAQSLSNIAVELEQRVIESDRMGRIKFALKKKNLDGLSKRVEEEKMIVVLSQELLQGLFMQRFYHAQLVQQRVSHQMARDIMDIKASVTHTTSAYQNPTDTKPQDQSVNTTVAIQTKSGQTIPHIGAWPQKSVLNTIFGAINFRRVNGQKASSTKISRDYIQARIWTPAWWARTVFEAQAFRASYGWDFSIRSYNIIPKYSLVFKYARDNNLEGLRYLFETRQATPFDRDTVGRTALHFAAYQSNPSMCQFLLEQGADPCARTFFQGLTPTSWMGLGVSELKSLSILSSTVEAYNGLDLEEVEKIYPFDTENDLEVTAKILKAVYPPYYETPLESRIHLLFRISRWGILYPDSIRLILQDGSIDKECFEGQNGGKILHCILTDHTFATVRADWDAWVSLYTEIMKSRPNLHDINEDCTPFLRLLQERYLNTTEKIKISMMRDYLSLLQAAGVDLVQYGRIEKSMYGRRPARKEFEYWSGKGGRFIKAKLISFSYGPEVADWHLWYSNPRDEYAGVFWHMVENPWEQIPGGWVDDDYSSDESPYEDDSDDE